VLLIRDVSWQAFSFHPNLPRLVTGGTNGIIVEWDLENATAISRRAVPAAPEFLKYSPEGSRFAMVAERGGQNSLSVHRFRQVEPLLFEAFPEDIGSVEWHPSGRWIGLADYDSAVRLMDSHTGEWRLLGHQKLQGVLIAFSPDGRYLISGGWEGELICWDLQGMKRSFTMGLDSWRLQFSGDGKRCAVVTKTGLKLYAFERPVDYREFPEALGARLEWAAFSPDGRWLAASGAERLGVWDLREAGRGALVNDGAEARLFFTPDSSELFGSCREDAAFRWRITPATDPGAAPQLQRLPFDKPEGFRSLCLVSNAIAVTSLRGTQLVPPNGQIREDLWTPTASGLSGASPDGQWFAVFPSYGARLRVYQLPGLSEVANLSAPSSIAWFQFSPQSDQLTVASGQQVDVWNTVTWARTRTVTNCMGMLFAPDASGWWLTQDFRTAGLYEARTLELLLPLPSGMIPLALSADGRRLAVSVDRRRLQVWDLVEVRERLRELGLDWGNQWSEVRKPEE
jgi:WD40 repeat protein